MKIIIAGAGRIGSSLAEVLSKEGHDITVIDRDEETISHVSSDIDVICMEGSATNPDVLAEAGAENADLLIAATEQDEVNMVCGISARKLGTQHVVARVRDTEYLGKTEFLREALGIELLVNPEYECAKEISRILRFPSASRVDAFSKGSLEIVEHRVAPGGMLDGVSLRDLQKIIGAKVLVSLAERDGKAIIPKGDFTVKGGDVLSITGISKELRKFFVAAGSYKRPVKNVMITGGGRTSVYLARILEENGISVTVIEEDRKRCEELCELIPDARIICGKASRSDVLLEEGIQSADGFVTLFGDDGDNIITSIYARHCTEGKIVTRINHEHFAEILSDKEFDSIVIPKKIIVQQITRYIVQQITRYVRAMSNSVGSSMETLYKLADGKAEALEFKINPDAKCIGIPIRELQLKPNVLFAALIRGGKSVIPDGSTEIKAGDHAVIVTEAGWLETIDGIMKGA